MCEELKIHSLEKTLDYIQSIISRLANNSFSIKTFTISLESAIPVFTIGKINIYIVIFLLLGVLTIFGLLDAYYLNLERKFRKLYEKAVHEGVSYDMYNLKLSSNINNSVKFIQSLKSKMILTFYGSQILILIVIMIIIYCNK